MDWAATHTKALTDTDTHVIIPDIELSRHDMRSFICLSVFLYFCPHPPYTHTLNITETDNLCPGASSPECAQRFEGLSCPCG